MLSGALFLSVERSTCRTQKGTLYGVHDAICWGHVREQTGVGKRCIARVAGLTRPSGCNLCILLLRGARFHLRNGPPPTRKRAHPQTYVFYFHFLLLRKWLQNELRYMKIRFARCSPITVSCTLKGLQYQLHHCQPLLFLYST